MAFTQALKLRWFWYSILCVLCWGAWAILSKLGSQEIPPQTMQFLFTLGTLPVGIALLIARRFQLERTVRGISFGLLNGVLSAVGSIALFAAYHTDGNTYVITVATAFYPMITVALSVALLRERLTRYQCLGIGFAGCAIVLFTL